MGSNSGMTMVMAMSMMICSLLIPLLMTIGIIIYRRYYGKSTGEMESESSESLTKDPGYVSDSCIVLMNNTPTNNPEGETERICLDKDQDNRTIDLNLEFKHLHDKISAARVGKDLILELYEHENSGGGRLVINGNTLQDGVWVDLTQKCINETGNCESDEASWNDIVSSLKIIRR